ncbi:MAG: hypothetical protein OQJ97_16655 [Rhodospirillales bacterium]|nr:hypothetical protein [Rhodospirillales bacterium]
MRLIFSTALLFVALTANAQAAEPNPNDPTPRMAIKFLLEQIPHYGGYNHLDRVDENGYKISKSNRTRARVEKNAFVLNETIDERGLLEGKGKYKALKANYITSMPFADLDPENLIVDEDYGARLIIRCKVKDCMSVAAIKVLETDADSSFSSYRRVKNEFEEKLEQNAPREMSKANEWSISFIELVRAQRVSRAFSYLVKEMQKEAQ